MVEENNKNNKKLVVGEKYLSIRLLGKIDLVAFPNKEKKKENEPDFKGDGVAVWVRKKKGMPTVEEVL